MADKVERKQGIVMTHEMETAEFKDTAPVKDFCGGLELRIKQLNPLLEVVSKLKRMASDSYHVCVRSTGDAHKPFALMEIYPSKNGYGVVQKFEAYPQMAGAFANVLGGIKPSSDGDIGGIAYVFTEFTPKLELTSFERLVAVCYAPSRQ